VSINTHRLAPFLLLGVALAVFSAVGPATAVENGSLGIRPATESDFFHLSVYPGAAIDATAIVSNDTNTPVTLLNYPVDAHSSAQGSFAMAAQTDQPSGVGAWVQLNTNDQITVPAGGQLNVPFRLTVPAGTPPGDYPGAIIIQSPPVIGKTTTLDGDTAVRLDVVQRQGVRIYLTVAGTAIKRQNTGALSWTQSGDSVTFTLPVHNSGNIILHPTASLSVQGWFGLDTRIKFPTPEAVLPGATYIFTTQMQHAPLVAFGAASATVTSEAGTQQARTNLLYIPWGLTVGILIALTALGYGIWRMVRFIRKARRALAQASLPQKTPPPMTRETLETVSAHTPRHRANKYVDADPKPDQ
jgi:hypothetical protein